MKTNTLTIPFFLLLIIQTTFATDLMGNINGNTTNINSDSVKPFLNGAKFLPTPAGLSGSDSFFGEEISIDGNRALIGGPGMGGGSGAVYVMEHNGIDWEQKSILRPNDTNNEKSFGQSISLNGDRALITSTNENNENVAYIFQYDGSKWTQSIIMNRQAFPSSFIYNDSVSLDGDRAAVRWRGHPVLIFDFDGENWILSQELHQDNNYFDRPISLKGDLLLIGDEANDENGFNSGTTNLYKYDNSWMLVQNLFALDTGTFDSFGSSVKIYNNSLFIGASRARDNHNNRTGAVYVFNKINDMWVQSQKIVPTNNEDANYFSKAISISGDQMIISANAEVYSFEYNGMDWIQTQRIVIDVDDYDNYREDGRDYFGEAVGISGDRVLVGSPRRDDTDENDSNNGHEWRSGAVYAFDFIGNWTESNIITAGNGSYRDYFGHSVSISGNIAAVGVPEDDDAAVSSGAVYIYILENNKWRMTQKLLASDGTSIESFGRSTDISGNRMIVGANGQVYIFDFDGNIWSEAQQLMPENSDNDIGFGYSVSLFGDKALVGSLGGPVYVFDFNGASWNQSQKLTADDGTTDGRFGISVDLTLNRLIIGADRDDDGGPGAGAAYIFDLQNNTWQQNQKIRYPSLSYNLSFGTSVSIHGDQVLVGAPQFSSANRGAVYSFQYRIGQWSYIEKILGDDSDSGDHFGYAVSMENNRVLIGAYAKEDGGSAYLFNLDGNLWVQSQKFLPRDTNGGGIGYSVSLSSDSALLGAIYDSENGAGAGAAHLIYHNLGDLISIATFE